MNFAYLTCDVYVHPLIIGWVIGGGGQNIQRIARETNTTIRLSRRSGHTFEVSGWEPFVENAINGIRQCEQNGMQAYHPQISYAPEPHQIISMADYAGFQPTALAPTPSELSVILTPPPPPPALSTEPASIDAPVTLQPPERLPSIVPPTSHEEGFPEMNGKSSPLEQAVHPSSSGLAQGPVKKEANDGLAGDAHNASTQSHSAVKEEPDQRYATLPEQWLSELLDLAEGRVVKAEPPAVESGLADEKGVQPATGEEDVGPQREAGNGHHDVLWYDANGIKLRAWTEADGTRFTVVTSEGRFYYYYSVATKNAGKRYQCRFCRRNANVEELEENGQKAWRFSGDFVSNHREDTKCVHAEENPWSNSTRKSAPCQLPQPPCHSADKPKKRLSADDGSAAKQMRLEEVDANDPAGQIALKSLAEWQQQAAAPEAIDRGTRQVANAKVAEVQHALQSASDDNVAMLHDVSLKSFERKIALAKYVVDALCDAEQDRPKLTELMHSVLIYKVDPEDAANDVPTRLALKTYKKICVSALPIVDERLNQMLRALRSDSNAATVEDILSGEVFDMVSAYTSELWQKARLPITASFVEGLLRVLLRCGDLDAGGRMGANVAELIRQKALQCVQEDDD